MACFDTISRDGILCSFPTLFKEIVISSRTSLPKVALWVSSPHIISSNLMREEMRKAIDLATFINASFFDLHANYEQEDLW